MWAEYLEELGDASRPLKVSRLRLLSDISGKELKLFQEAWKKIPLERRQEILSHLVLLNQETFEVIFDSVFRSCLEDSDAAARAKAVEGLWGCENPSLISPLVKMLKEDKEEGVRANAAIALGSFALLAEYKELRPRYTTRVKETLLSVIDNTQESIEVRRRAIEAIGALSFPRVKTIIEEAYHSPESRMQVSAIFAMGRNADLLWLPFVLKELDNPSPEIRLEAVRACGELGEEKVVPYLSKLAADDSERQIRLEALVALGKIGGEKAKQALRPWLRHRDKEIRQVARIAWEEAVFMEDTLKLAEELDLEEKE